MAKIIGLAALLLAWSASAEPPTGGALALECRTGNAACVYYLLGMWDGLILTAELAQAPLLCPGTTPVNGQQLVLVFNKWAAANPEFLNRDRGDVAAAAFVSSFPCKR